MEMDREGVKEQGSSVKFNDDPNWEKGTELRKSFEKRFQDDELEEILRGSPGCGHPLCGDCTICFGGCPRHSRQAGTVNRQWCTKVNQELLHPAGYSCSCDTIYVHTDKGRQEVMQIQIRKRAP
eukprot:CAMPEP_0173430230 /NCGR_PEP_ID=MMETSP1357-20121228/8714_1 /TAXON_ID=77926 /ORGANISM="Hemiselmis rufescens, Strain PCC563" /LENGTH=123 /DNA_ID=CAMNT_0014394535 /DNA_START=176 /DNA_END=548 /DNA_ORIENTATION=+